MLLRASGEQTNQVYDVHAVTDVDRDPGVAHASHLRALSEAAVQGDWLSLFELRKRADADMGPQATTDTLVVAAAFNGITRVADATGIPLDENTATGTEAMRNSTGIQRFAYDEKTNRYG